MMELVDVFGTNGCYKINLETSEVYKFNLSKYSNKNNGSGSFKLDKSIVRGYVKVCINGKRVSLHRIVMQTYTNSNGYGLQVNHIDGDKQNNHYSNLEWCTCVENIRHAVKTGLKGGRQNCVRKDRGLSDEKVIDIKTMIRDGYSNVEIQRKHNIKPNTFHYIKNGRNYNYITI